MLDIKDKDELVAKARAQSAKVDDDFRGIVELYYFARYFMSVFEARNHELPIQVWNEYRNALDHYTRHLTTPPDAPNPKDHLDKMRGHMQRAALDVLKLVCHKSLEWYDERRATHSVRALTLVQDGTFLTNVESLKRNAEMLLIKAKVNDSNLGDDAKRNKKIVAQYIDAAFAFEELRNAFDDASAAIINAEHQVETLTDHGLKKAQQRSFWIGVAASVIATGLITVIAKYWPFS